MIKLINGLLTPTEGEILIDGTAPGVRSKSIVSYLPERTYLDESMRIAEAIDYFGDFYRDFDRNKALKMLKKVNLDPSLRIKTLSKGNKEKVQLILVMSRRAKLYCLDEPIAGVDPAATILLSTHLISDVENILDEVVFIQNGHIRMQEEVETIRDKEGKSVDDLFREVFKC